MKENTLHVVSGLSSRGKLLQSLGQLGIKETVMYLPTNFSFGYIPKDFSDKELCFSLASRDQIDEFDNLKKFVTIDYSAYEKVIVWHGWSANDLLLLYLMSVLTDGSIYQIDIRSQYPDMGCVSVQDIIDNNMISLAKPVNKEEKQYYREQWYKWANSNSPYRFSDIHTGVIKEYPENFMDSCIIESVKETDNLFMIIGAVMTKFDHLFIPDFIIYRRILELQKDRVLRLSVTLNENK